MYLEPKQDLQDFFVKIGVHKEDAYAVSLSITNALIGILLLSPLLLMNIYVGETGYQASDVTGIGMATLVLVVGIFFFSASIMGGILLLPISLLVFSYGVQAIVTFLLKILKRPSV